ncbi:MAG: DotU family type IV/VI secretion system protein [Isosphaeraceae bacterium]|nr:DotU family type IV/VI secretion system protein [Isosphaeraceae bacterium]
MKEPFSQLVTPVIQYVIDLQRRLQRGEDPGLREVRDQLLGLLDEAEQRATAASDLAADYDLAKHALVYWIDEVLINSRWSQAADWREHILEWDFFRERLGGEKFFDKAEEAERRAGTDPLEVFFLCVALGFQGKYAARRPELQRWAARVFGRIAAGASPPERFLPDDPDDATNAPLQPLPGKTVLLAVSVLTSVTVLVTLACFLLSVHLMP